MGEGRREQGEEFLAFVLKSPIHSLKAVQPTRITTSRNE
jgi:hypothetical protein